MPLPGFCLLVHRGKGPSVVLQDEDGAFPGRHKTMVGNRKLSGNGVVGQWVSKRNCDGS